MKNLEPTSKASFRIILWHRLSEMFRAGVVRVDPKQHPPRATESITVMGSTEAEYLALKRALIRAGCPHIRIAAQFSKGFISATIPIPPDRDRLELCIMKAGLIPYDTEGGSQC